MPSSEFSRSEKMPQPANGACVLLYDGDCGLCWRTVRWMRRHDPQGRLHFAPLQQLLAAEVFARHKLDPQRINSAVLVSNFNTPQEQLLLRSDAILGCLGVLGGAWANLAVVTRLVPRALRDVAYKWIVRNRYRLFADGASCTPHTRGEYARLLDI